MIGLPSVMLNNCLHGVCVLPNRYLSLARILCWCCLGGQEVCIEVNADEYMSMSIFHLAVQLHVQAAADDCKWRLRRLLHAVLPHFPRCHGCEAAASGSARPDKGGPDEDSEPTVIHIS